MDARRRGVGNGDKGLRVEKEREQRVRRKRRGIKKEERNKKE